METTTKYTKNILSYRQDIMGNKHHRVNIVLTTYLVVVMSAHECLTSQEDQATLLSELVRLESTSGGQNG